LENAGQVARLSGPNAEVLVTPGEACGSCSNASYCGGGNKKRRLLARNPLGAQTGDWVVVSVDEARGTLSALVVFGIPALAILAGVLAGGLLLGKDLWAGILAGVGLVAGVLVVKIVDRQAQRSGRGLPEIVRRLDSPEAFTCKGGGSEAVADDRAGAGDGDGAGTGR
jgi:sigma-E factor negative regulatory protein RseC